AVDAEDEERGGDREDAVGERLETCHLTCAGRDRLVRHPDQDRLLRRADVFRLPAVQVAPVREPERARRARPAAGDRVEERRVAVREARVRAPWQLAAPLALERRDEARVRAAAARSAREVEDE